MCDEQDYVCSITPTEFEQYCLEILEGYAETENLKDFKIDHNVKIITDDGEYQIDVYASFVAMDVEIKVICECKQYKNRVKRDKVILLADKIRSIGAHKGILLSTSGFQSGAIEYAKKHGIALIQVYDRSCDKYSFANGPDAIPNENDPLLYVFKHMPPYRAVNCTTENEYKRSVYPKRSTMNQLYAEQFRLMRQQGYNVKWPIDEGEQEET